MAFEWGANRQLALEIGGFEATICLGECGIGEAILHTELRRRVSTLKPVLEFLIVENDKREGFDF